MEKWNKNSEISKNTITALDLEQFQIMGEAYFNKKFKLVGQIQRLHLIGEKINLIIENLNKSISEDDKARDKLFEQKMSTMKDRYNRG